MCGTRGKAVPTPPGTRGGQRRAPGRGGLRSRVSTGIQATFWPFVGSPLCGGAGEEIAYARVARQMVTMAKCCVKTADINARFARTNGNDDECYLKTADINARVARTNGNNGECC